MPDGELDADRFIINTDGGMAKYLGRTVKRPAPTADDFLLIQPEQVVVSTVRLDRYYALPEHGQITVVYQAFNPSVGGQPMIKLRSNEANISLP